MRSPRSNRVVGLNSFGPTGPAEKVLLMIASSILNDWFVDIWNAACDQNFGACD